MRIAEKARDHGLASLAEDSNRADNEFMRAGLMGLAAGHSAAELQAATGRAMSGAGEMGAGTEVRRIVEAGLLMIRDGGTPEAIRENLGALRTAHARTAHL